MNFRESDQSFAPNFGEIYKVGTGEGGGGSFTETDPTVPAWAKKPNPPTYTAQDVGADPAGTAAAQVTDHNTNTGSHTDIRLLVSGLTGRVGAAEGKLSNTESWVFELEDGTTVTKTVVIG